MKKSDLFLKDSAENKNYKIKKASDDIWTESGFGKYSWRNETARDGTASFVGSAIPKIKFLAIKFTIFFILLVMAGKVFYLQIAQGKKYKEWAETNRVRQIPIIAQRGIIYDRNQRPLVSNIPNFYLSITPSDLSSNPDDKIKILQKISEILDILPEEIEEKLSAFSAYNYQSIPVKTGISYEQAVKLEILAHALSSVQVEMGIGRKYDIPRSLSHIIGYLRKVDKKDLENNSDFFPTDDAGKAGLELQYEKVLRGSYGKKQIEVDALGRQTTVLAKEDPIAGDNLILTIDFELQKKSEEILRKHLSAHGLKRGAIIISEASTGEILAMASAPFYDNNIFSGELSAKDYGLLINDPNKPMFNRAISGEYPSGSTVKPVFAAAALEDGLITEKTSFLSTGGIKINEWFFPDWKQGGHGTTNVRKALAESVNTFFYIIVGGLLDDSLKNYKIPGLGVEKLKAYAKKFGLSAKLGIDLPAEAAGFFPNPEWKEKEKKEPWYIGDTYHLAIGQGDVLVTPMQVNFWTAAIANGGTLFRPYVVKTILHQDGTAGTTAPKIINKNFIKQENVEIVRLGLRDGVIYGSSSALGDLNFQVAGKTGTAQWGTNKTPHAWFTGFAPYNNPEIAITVLLEEGGEGSKTAVPIAKEILWWYFNILKTSS